MCCLGRLVAVSLLLWLPGAAAAGLYYSGETYAELPSQWRGFLIDQRTLRQIAVKPAAGNPASPARLRYLEEAARLEKAGNLSADDLADLGALQVRLGEAGKAITLLRPAQRQFPNHFRIVANLGTAWQIHGDLEQAILCLEQSARLAPGKYQAAEEYHLKLVRLRLRRVGSAHQGGGGGGGGVGGQSPPYSGNAQELDDLFSLRYGGDSSRYEPGKIAAAELKKLPARGVAVVQQLALWLPADPRLLWQLAELANAHGDVKTAAAMMDGCVTQFGLQAPLLKQHRQLLRAAAVSLPPHSPPWQGGARGGNETSHAGTLAARSKRPLLSKLDQAPLPAIEAAGINVLPWEVLAETVVDRKFRPTFARYLRDLENKQVTVNGFMQPLREDPDMTAFMFIEYPVGCWYCEMPETIGIVYVELPAGKTVQYTRGLVRVTGRFTLNATDPEDFLYAIRSARVGELD